MGREIHQQMSAYQTSVRMACFWLPRQSTSMASGVVKHCEILKNLILRVFWHRNALDARRGKGEPGYMTQPRILVINDTQEILELFKDLLEEEGYEVILSSFAPKTVYEIGSLQPDLVILDLIFGSERAGWQLLQQLRMYHPTAKIPVVVCTAARDEVREMEPQLVSHGALLVLKPFDIDEITFIVRQALNLPHTSAPLQLPNDDSHQLTRHEKSTEDHSGKRAHKSQKSKRPEER